MLREIKAIARWVYIVAIVIIIAIAGAAYYFLMPAAPEVKPIKIGYVGDVASPGTRPCMDIIEMAAEEINDAGGILGRPIRIVIGNGRGTTELSVSEARRLVMEEDCLFVMVEGRSEIAHAVQEACAELFPDYPHILVANGPMDSGLTAKVVENYDKYKFFFRDWDPEPAHYSWIKYFYKTFRDALNATKMALLFEGLAWTTMWRPPEIGGTKVPGWEDLPDWKEFAGEYGLEVVYCKALSPKEPNYLPIFEEISAAGAEVILYVTSWFTNNDAFAMQWAESATKDIPICLYGGVHQTAAFWTMTLGRALGSLATYFEPTAEEWGDRWPPEHLELLEKARERGISLQINTHFAYADIYFFKKAIEEAGGTDDIDALIEAMETVELRFSLGKLKYQTERVSPFYRSRVLCDPHDPFKLLPGYYVSSLAQWQYDPVAKKPKLVPLFNAEASWDTLEAWEPATPSPYIPPKVLRGG